MPEDLPPPAIDAITTAASSADTAVPTDQGVPPVRRRTSFGSRILHGTRYSHTDSPNTKVTTVFWPPLEAVNNQMGMKRLHLDKVTEPDASTIANSLVTIHYKGTPPDAGSAFYEHDAPTDEPCDMWFHIPVDPSNKHQSLRSFKVSHPAGTKPANGAGFSSCIGGALTSEMREQSYADGLAVLQAANDEEVSRALKAALASQSSWLQGKECPVKINDDGTFTVNKHELRKHLLANCARMFGDGEVNDGFAGQVEGALNDCTEEIDFHASKGSYVFTSGHARQHLFELSRIIFDELNTRTDQDEALEDLLLSAPLTDFEKELDVAAVPVKKGKHGINPAAYYTWAGRHRMDAEYHLSDPDAPFTELEATPGHLMITISPRSEEEMNANVQLMRDGIYARVALERGEELSDGQLSALRAFSDYTGVQMDASFFLPGAKPIRGKNEDTITDEASAVEGAEEHDANQSGDSVNTVADA